MIDKKGNYFLSDEFVNQLQKAKEEKKTNSQVILAQVLIAINRQRKLKLSNSGMKQLLDYWKVSKEETDPEPALKRNLDSNAIYNKFGEDRHANFLETISDLSVSNSPCYTCFLVTCASLNKPKPPHKPQSCLNMLPLKELGVFC